MKPWLFRTRPLLGIVVVALCTACGGDSGPRTDPSAPPGPLPVARVSVTPSTLTLSIGSTQQLSAVVLDASGNTLTGRTVTWTSSDQSKAAVSSSGLVTATAAGTATITATSEGKSGEAAVTIPAVPVSTITLSSTSLNLSVGSTQQLSATTRDAGGGVLQGRTIAWQSSDSTKATVSSSGVVTAIAAGAATITAASEGKTASAAVSIFSLIAIVQGEAQTAQIMASLPVVPTVRVVDAQGNPRAGVVVNFAASNSGILGRSSASTAADGTTSPGSWTLGEDSGAQTLTATFGTASVVFHATATGTATFFQATSVAVGFGASCAVLPTGDVSCWGDATKLGGAANVDQTRPVALRTNRVFTSLNGSFTHFCGIVSDGTAVCWGQSALTSPSSQDAVPTAVAAPEGWQQFAPLFTGNCGISTSQKTYCWGSNAQSQLGDGTSTDRNAPTLVFGGFVFTQVSGATTTTCGMTADGTAYCWGWNQSGEVGDGTNAQTRASPTATNTTLRFKKVVTGASFSCGLTTTGNAACWGYSFARSPATLDAGQGVSFVDIFAGGDAACALTADGTAYCWGANPYGELGDGTTSSRYTPARVATTLKFKMIALQQQHTCGITTSGAVACWGRNSFGELGDGTKSDHFVPKRIVLGVVP